MKNLISIFLFSMIMLMVLPWQLVCLAHPTGHTHHHEPGELSPCEQRKLSTETSIWPPMDCHKLTISADDYQLPENDKLTPSVQTFALAFVLMQLVQLDFTEDIFVQLPDPKCHSGPPLSSHLLRAPPIV